MGPTCKIVDEVGDWDRSDLTITSTKANLSTQFVIDVESTGQHFELETNALMGIGGFTAEVHRGPRHARKQEPKHD